MKDFDTCSNEEKADLFLALSKMIKYRMMEEESLKLNKSLDASFNSDKIEDGEYLYLLQKILNREDSTKLIISQAQKRIIYSKTQCDWLSEFKPKYREIKNFCLKEKERLKDVVPTSEIGIKEDSRIFLERLEEKKRLEIKQKVDLLINIHDEIILGKSEIKPLQFNLERFSCLFKEYANEAFFLKSQQMDDTNIRIRLDKISNVIDYYKDSLDLPKDIKKNPELQLDVIKLLYATCYTGDYKTFNTLFEKLGNENLQTIFFSSIPILKSEEDKKGLITLEGMATIIFKRLNKEKNKKTPNQIQIAGWTEVTEKMQKLADDAWAQLGSSEGIAGMSLAKDDDGGPAARSTRLRDAGSAERVDRSAEMPKDDRPPAKR